MKKRLVEMDKPVTLEIQPDEMAVLLQPDGSVTHYVPGKSQEDIPVSAGILAGMASTIKVFSGHIELLMEAMAELAPEEDEEK